MKSNITLSVLYVYYNTPLEIEESIRSLRKAIGRLAYEIIIVDNNSLKPIPQTIAKASRIRIVQNKQNKGYGAALNQGALKAKGAYILCANPDIKFEPESIQKLLKRLKTDEKIGVIGPLMKGDEGNLLDTASEYPTFPKNLILFSFLRKLPFFSTIVKRYHYRGRLKSEKKVKVLGGACMLFRKSVFEKIGGFDEQFFLYFEESDICKRINERGYRCLYYPKSKIIHHVGRSLSDKRRIQAYFERSRFTFVKKHQGFLKSFLSEGILRFFSIQTLLLLCLVSLSLFLNLFRITDLLMFHGDFARDMIAARDMVLYGDVPLVGIPSSVVWLHQGPLSIYLIALSFLIGGFAPWVPAAFYAILGSLTTVAVYKLGSELFNRKVGIMSAFVFVTSPLVVINSRIPYHTAPIPFFSVLFFFSVYLYLKHKSRMLLFFIGLFFGLLFQLELSNGLLAFFLLSLVFIYKLRFALSDFVRFIAGTLFGIFPFFLYDITHGFVQTLGFTAWVVNRVRLFLGLTVSGDATTGQVPSAFLIIWEQLIRFIFPSSKWVTLAVILAGLILFTVYSYKLLRKKNSSLLLLTFGLLIPILGFIVHARPGTAYFPLIFPLLSIAVALVFYTLSKRIKMLYVLFVLLGLVNVTYILNNSYFLDIGAQRGSNISDWNYGLGPSFMEQRNAVVFIKQIEKNDIVSLQPGGFLGDFQTSIDTYRYIAWWEGVRLGESEQTYTIYQDFSEIPSNTDIVYQSENIAITKHE